MLGVETIGRRFADIRERTKLSEAVAAEAAGVTVEELQDCEKGVAQSAGRLARLAAVYGLSETDVVGEGEVPDSAVSVLLRGDAHGEALALHLGRFASIGREFRELQDLLGMSARGRVAGFPPAGQPPDPPFAQAESLAALVREKLALGLAPVRSMFSLLADIGICVIWTDRLGEDVQGLSLYDPGVGPSIVASRRGRRQAWWTLRSTLAHELCHVLFDRTPAAPLGIASRREQREPLEQRANAFGVHFLAPREGVARFLGDRGCVPYELDRHDVHALMNHFGLGKEAATWHLRNVDWITEDARIALLQHVFPLEPEADVESHEVQPGLAAWHGLDVDVERLALAPTAVAAHSRRLITEGRLRAALGLDPFVDLESALAT